MGTVVLQNPGDGRSRRVREGEMKGAGREGRTPTSERKWVVGTEGGRVKSGGDPCTSAGRNSWPRATPGLAGSPGREGGRWVLPLPGPCLTLFAASGIPRRPSACCCAREAEETVAQPGLPDLRRGGGPGPPPLARPGHFASLSRRRRARTLPRTPLPLIWNAPSQGFPGIGAALLRPQRRSLRLTSLWGGRRGKGAGQLRRRGRRERAGGGNMAAGSGPGSACAGGGGAGVGPWV